MCTSISAHDAGVHRRDARRRARAHRAVDPRGDRSRRATGGQARARLRDLGRRRRRVGTGAGVVSKHVASNRYIAATSALWSGPDAPSTQASSAQHHDHESKRSRTAVNGREHGPQEVKSHEQSQRYPARIDERALEPLRRPRSCSGAMRAASSARSRFGASVTPIRFDAEGQGRQADRRARAARRWPRNARRVRRAHLDADPRRGPGPEDRQPRYAEPVRRPRLARRSACYQLRELTPEVIGRWQADRLAPGAPVDSHTEGAHAARRHPPACARSRADRVATRSASCARRRRRRRDEVRPLAPGDGRGDMRRSKAPRSAVCHNCWPTPG